MAQKDCEAMDMTIQDRQLAGQWIGRSGGNLPYDGAAIRAFASSRH